MQAGILFSAMSAAVNFLGGDRMITGGMPSGALGIFLCLLLGGFKGSSTTFEIWTIRWMPVVELQVGVYRTKVSFSTFFKAAVQRNAGLLFFEIF
jgi:hypothetical protein